jgi:hypothetical protein
LVGICAITPGVVGWRRDRASANQSVVTVAAGSSSRATHRLAGSGRRQQARYSPVPSAIVPHMQQPDVRLSVAQMKVNRRSRSTTGAAQTADQSTGR